MSLKSLLVTQITKISQNIVVDGLIEQSYYLTKCEIYNPTTDILVKCGAKHIEQSTITHGIFYKFTIKIPLPLIFPHQHIFKIEV